MNQQAKVRDKAAHGLWIAHKEKLRELRFNQLNPEKIQQAADRHEDVIITEKYEVLKTEHPIFAKYDELLKQRKHLTGYYQERIDKKIQETTKNIMANKQLMAQIKQCDPRVMNQIINQVKCNSRPGLEHGH